MQTGFLFSKRLCSQRSVLFTLGMLTVLADSPAYGQEQQADLYGNAETNGAAVAQPYAEAGTGREPNKAGDSDRKAPFKLQASHNEASRPTVNNAPSEPSSVPQSAPQYGGIQDQGRSDSFGGLKSLFASQRTLRSYAECDTGYGVCGVVLNVPLGRAFTSIRTVYPSMPAAEAGIQAGDVVLAVNGRSTKHISVTEVWDWFTGPPNTPVALVIRRGDNVGEIVIKRMDIGRIPNPNLRSLFLTAFKENGASRLLPMDH